MYCLCCGDVHGGGETVVGALRAVDVVVGVDRGFPPSALAGELVGAAGNHLVDVHVALGAATGLPDHQRKLLVVLPGQYLVSGLLNQPGNVGWQVAVTHVDPGGRLLDQRQGVQDSQRHPFLANCEVDQRALRLGAPVGLIRNFDRSQAVCFVTAHAAVTPLSSDSAV